MSKKKPPFNKDAVLRSAWKRTFSRSPFAIEVKEEGKRYVPKFNKDGSRSKKDSVEYHCQVCDKYVKASVNGKNNISVDHIIPVIAVNDVSGKVKDWNVFEARLYCDKSNLQRICSPCHLLKTNLEKSTRQILKDKVILDRIEEQVKAIDTIEHAKNLLKETRKYLTKKKANSTKQRAQELIVKLKDIIERQD